MVFHSQCTLLLLSLSVGRVYSSLSLHMANKSINAIQSNPTTCFVSITTLTKSSNQSIKTNLKTPMKNKNNHNKNIVLNKNITRSPQMDPRIWSKLPPEILEYILSFLPLKTFLNLRSTCKGFWSLIFSPSFITKHSSSTTPFSSFLLLSHPQFHRHFPLYDCTLAAWRNISLSLSDSFHNNSSSPNFTTSIVSSGGLFCISDSSSCSLLVCNLLSKSSRMIEYPSFVFLIEHLTFVTSPNGYTIFVLCSQSSSSSSSNSAFVYNSNMLSWTKFESFDPILSNNHYQQGVLYNGGLFFATPEPFSLVRFDLKSGKWETNIGELPNQVTFIRLASDGEGKLYLIGGVGNNGISRSIKMWEMSEEGNWVEVEVLPELMCKKFVSVCYHNYEHVYCFWHEGMICICCYTWPEILYYLVSRRTWHWLPRCPSLSMKCSCGFKWFSFVPKLYASV